MSFISYAQNFEDVMLWRALKHINNGFYIDIGAWSPDIHSVTRAFYEFGWKGINIEPNPDYHKLLMLRRPKDINLKIAVSDTPGILEMSIIENPDLSTLDQKIASTHQAAGWSMKTQYVDVKTIQQIWEEYIPQGLDVHFLKIDIEGLEEAAIRGNDWTCNRPWIVVVEATLPMSQVESHHAWEPMFIDSGYRFVYADGLNRFYIAEERNSLREAFKYPPNVFDEYTLANHVDAKLLAAKANERANQVEAQAAQANERAHAYLKQLEAMQNSRSWRMTKPLRLAGKFARWFVRGTYVWLTFAPGSRPRRISRKALVYLMNKVRANPRLNMWGLTWINKSPKLKQRLRNIAIADTASFFHFVHRLAGPADLAPRARQIYRDLKTAIENKKRDGG